jgi:hypothetical protein
VVDDEGSRMCVRGELILAIVLAATLANSALAQSGPEEVEAPSASAGEPTRTTDPEPIPQPHTPVFHHAEGPPEGFESLMEAQRTLVDVNYGGNALSPAFAIFAPGRFEFEDPAAVVADIPGVKDQGEVTRALSGLLAPHGGRVCRRPGVPEGCGRLWPETAGIIFDADRFSVEIFLHPRVLDVPVLEVPRYLPLPNDEFSGVASLTGSYSGLDPGPDAYDMRTDVLVAYGPRHLRVAGGVRTGGLADLDQAVAEINWPDYEATGGLFRTRPLRAIGDREVLAARFSTSLKTRTRLSLDRAYSIPILVFLARRSRVELRRDGRLLSSGIYDAGNQEIDTSSLPEGAYDVEVRILDKVSGDQRETRFFAKSTDLPPRGELLYFAEAGALRSRGTSGRDLDFNDGALAHIGGALRHTDRIGYDADVALLNRDVVFGLGSFLMERGVNLRVGAIASHRGAGGIELLGSASRWGVWGNLNVRGLWGNADADSLRDPYTQITGVMGTTVGDFQLRLMSSWRRTEIGSTALSSYAVTPSLRWRFLRRSRMRGDLLLEYSQMDRGPQVWLGIDFASWYRNWFAGGSGGSRYSRLDGDGDATGEADGRGIWHDGERWPGDARISIDARSREPRHSLGAKADYRGPRGGASLYTEEAWHEDFPDQTLYGGTFGLGLVGRPDGVSAGGTGDGRSAVIVDLRGTPEGATFEVFTGSVRRAAAVVGQPSLLFLPPYESYDVRIVAGAEHLTDYDTAGRRVTLFPGTTSRLVWDIEQVFILVAEIVLPDGTPVTNSGVEGAVGNAATDDYGMLQAEVRSGSELKLHFDPGLGFCRVQVPEPEPGEDVILAEQLFCQ